LFAGESFGNFASMNISNLSSIGELESRLAALEKQAFTENKEDRNTYTEAVTQYAASFLDTLSEQPTFYPESHAKDATFRFSDEGEALEPLLQAFKEEIIPTGINAAGPGHLGYIPGGGIYEAALGDYLADVTNRYAGIFYASPGAVRMENALIRWVGKLVGYEDNFGGNLTTGGSIANLIGIGAAKFKFGIKGHELHKHVLYLTEHTHHCVPKALRITGLEECVIRKIPLDNHFRMQADVLEKQVQADFKSGLKPFLVIASAGTTDIGAIDPMNAIADITEKYKLWLHVDGAYGGFFLLTEQGKKKMEGIHRADSFIVDPHKSLFLPYGLGMVIVKDAENLKRANTFTGNYMQDALGFELEDSPADMSPELTKHWRGLRMWLPLKLHGIAKFRAALEEKHLLARYAWEILRSKGFEMGPEPQLSVLVFRYPKENEALTDQFNRQVLKRIHDDGRYFISSTMVDGKFHLRMAILSFRTHKKHVDDFLKILMNYLID
jgi:glutamate/tyrosine decarboxylase-like PLP-dependent enzyme